MEQGDRERLERYDRMYRDLLKELDGILRQQEELKAAGRVKSVTYQQLLANKLTVQNLIGRFEIYGIGK
ncbi:hypothetical protein H8790_01200 [Oscillibacter hominis]|uniref:Uncharacterized protein n=1 Tax=Oscillibacter hominis TaxID=2763056 RepID=A0A7G9B570_9FIRM|nr:hypothetical protein [Oscillibacter hominis]QNL44701.1 hypothetical protein H8790_01200 [Oscillibacter hominis]